VKHMSAQARADFYKKIVIPYNKKAEKKIPVVASHMGFSGRETLTDLIKNQEKENDNAKVEGFYAWNINLCEEDVKVIHESGGLIGLSFDQRILGVDTVILGITFSNKRKNSIEAFINTIERIVAVPFKEGLDNPENIWHTLTIGTDFEGFIDPINDYSNALDFSSFAEDLQEGLEELKQKSPELFGNWEVEDIVEGIAFKNAYQFLKVHMPPEFKESEKPII